MLNTKLKCVACPPPRLILKFKLRPSWNNIHNEFPTGTAPDTIPVLNNSALKQFENIQNSDVFYRASWYRIISLTNFNAQFFIH